MAQRYTDQHTVVAALRSDGASLAKLSSFPFNQNLAEKPK